MKKLLYSNETYVKRKEFKQVKKNYELRRGQFYRDLGGDEKTSIDVEEEEIRSFWNTTESEGRDFSDF